MVTKGLLATVQAKEGKEKDVEDFLKSAVDLAKKEDKTVDWFAFKIDSNTFGIFDTFNQDDGREAHLNGEIASHLMANADTLLKTQPSIKKIDILGSK
ncbi:putative quinol monooxygenase [Salinimicrobium soli]|uniref:putative quinol monooxygenase n=1 Tax=Salinimicrobium soli TaxID=1254399 RepID=UPI003AAB82BB